MQELADDPIARSPQFELDILFIYGGGMVGMVLKSLQKTITTRPFPRISSPWLSSAEIDPSPSSGSSVRIVVRSGEAARVLKPGGQLIVSFSNRSLVRADGDKWDTCAVWGGQRP